MDLLRKFKDKYGEGIKKSVVECAELPDQGIAELTEAEHAVRRSRLSFLQKRPLTRGKTSQRKKSSRREWRYPTIFERRHTKGR